jgi:hypothetical protein
VQKGPWRRKERVVQSTEVDFWDWKSGCNRGTPASAYRTERFGTHKVGRLQLNGKVKRLEQEAHDMGVI